MTGQPLVSIVIPAHNEETVIARCLDALLRDSQPGEFDIVVAANGCTDRTAQVARRYRPRGVRVVETEVASKPQALNLGDTTARCWPRIYLDADVVIDTDTARQLGRVLAADAGPLASAPRLRVDARRSSAVTRAYMNVFESLPVFGRGYVGSGCFALSATGRARFGEFPDQIGDDRFVNSLFAPEEKLTLPDRSLTITAPRTLRALVRRSVRVRSGTRSLARFAATSDYVVRDAGSGPTTRAHLLALARSGAFARVAVFGSTQVAVSVLARYQAARGRDRLWLRDDTSRS